MSDTPPKPPSSPLSAGLMWASRATVLGMEFVLPPLLGYMLDSRWKTQPIFTVVGSFLGFASGMLHLLAITREGSRR